MRIYNLTWIMNGNAYNNKYNHNRSIRNNDVNQSIVINMDILWHNVHYQILV